MNMRELSGFVKIVETGSFSLAADTLYISQSALSQQIKNLERSLGFQLFQHGRHRASLTQAGEQFYFYAKKILEQYQDALEECAYLSQNDSARVTYLQVGCLEDQFIRYWVDLTQMTGTRIQSYTPRFVRYESRTALFTSLLKGETDLTLQMECPDIENNRLIFQPLTTVREICHNCIYTNISESPETNPSDCMIQNPSTGRKPVFPADHILSVEDLFPYTLAFHNASGKTLFEDSLRSYIRLHSPQTKILEPKDFFTADYRKPIFLLVPAPQFTHRIEACDYMLDFEENIRLGFVISPNCRPEALEYIKQIQNGFRTVGKIWDFQ